MGQLINIVLMMVLLAVAYGVGTIVEREHYRKILLKEEQYLDLPVVTSRRIAENDDILTAVLVSGSVVISLDYFKRFLAGLRNIVGGRVSSYETLLDRGRREAVLRMKQAAYEMGADMVINMRFERSSIGNVTSDRKSQIGCFELLAYGMAVTLKKKQ